MKKKVLILSLAFVGLMVVLAIGCKKSSVVKDTCTSGTNCGKSFQACCSLTQCYYTYNGKKYNCDGTSCGSAATDLVADMCGKKKAGLDATDSGVQELLKLTKVMADNAKSNAGE
jgi:hypothetical protein